MRFVTYQGPDDGPAGDRVGVLRDGAVHPLGGVARLVDLLGDRQTLLDAGEAALRDDTHAVGIDAVRLRAPIPRPPSVRDFMTFEDHIAGAMLIRGPDAVVAPVWYQQPLFYFSNPVATIGPRDDVPLPPGSHMFDFELEVAAIIGPGGTNLSVERALDHVIGYTIMNDWSARDLQWVEMSGNLGPAKGKDTATTLGPCLVTADELAPFASGPSFALEMEVELNGKTFGADRLDNMAWSFAQMAAYASRGTRLEPGDVLGSGTCGNGCLAEKWGREGQTHPPLAVGDVVTLRVEQLGEVSNRIVEGDPVHDLGPCRAG